MNANPAVMRKLRDIGGGEIGEGRETVADFVTGKDVDLILQMLVIMAFLSIKSAIIADGGTQRMDEEIEVAREIALAFHFERKLNKH